MIAVVLAVVAGVRPAPAQDTPRELRQRAAAAMGEGQFEEAIPPIEQLIAWFKDSRDATVVSEMESLYYSLGLCRLFIGHFPQSRAAFQAYLKAYPRTPRSGMAQVFIADAWRYESRFPESIKAYEEGLKRYGYPPHIRTDLLACIAKCHLAGEDWTKAVPLLIEVARGAYDPGLRNWAASMLTVSYLKELNVEPVYDLMPLLLQPGSFAARSVALNVSALQAGDELFADERYRHALWIYRLVHPHDTLAANARAQLETYQRAIRRLRRMSMAQPRELLRAQETVAELEAETEALAQVPNYDPELFFRIARSYFEIRRYREAAESFYRLYEEGLTENTEECLYLSFLAAGRIEPRDLALARGDEYMRAYPAGAFYDAVSLTVGQIHAQRQDWPRVLGVLGQALTVSPKHENIVECLFLMGYASFMEEQFDDAIRQLTRMNSEFPGNEREADGSYWLGMANLFDKRYAEAAPHFARVVEAFPDGVYAVDAEFRVATCAFGLREFEDCERRLLDFVRVHAGHALEAEAWLMLGDVSGADGRLPEAVERYRRAMDGELEMTLYNHAAFRAGEILAELKDHAGVIAHFTRYIERAKEGSNISLAVYWIGEAYWDMERPDDAFRYFRQAIDRFGRDRADLGIDLIIETYIGRTRNTDADTARRAWTELRAMQGAAVRADQMTLLLRLNRAALFDPAVSAEEQASMRGLMLRPESLPHASAGVLEYILDQARAGGRTELALQAADRLIADFAETDYALAARAFRAEEALAREAYDEALPHLEIIREVYAATEEAARALLSLGRIHLERKRFKEADESYRDVTGVREWRAYWPAALFGRGETARAQRRFDQAAAYFERIYVLYGNHRDWVAKAYLARAQCLQQLRKVSGALETLDEMLARAELEATPEWAEAVRLRDTLRSSR